MDWPLGAMMWLHVVLGEHDEARALGAEILGRNMRSAVAKPLAVANLAAISEFEGDRASAEAFVKEVREKWPWLTIAVRRKFLRTFKDQAFLEKYLDALRRAGLPEA